MIRIATVLAVFLCYVVAARAEPIVVRAGEHPGFSRLVLRLEQDRDWQLGRVDGGYALRLGQGGEFALDDVFRLIPRNRLQDLRAGEGGRVLFLRVRPGVHAIAFETGADALVIDVRDGSAPDTSPFERPLDALATVEGAGHLPRPVPPPHLELFWRDILPEAAQVYPAPKAPPPDQREPEARLAAAEAALLENLGRAAAQGLIAVEMERAPPSALADQPDEPRPAASPEPENQNLPTDPPSVLPLSVHAETAVDHALQAERNPVQMTSVGTPCDFGDVVDIAAWGDARPFDQQVSEAKANLLGEFDRADPDAVVRLSRLYLYHGFGAEARATILAFGLKEDQAASLLAMSDIMDFGFARAAPAFADMLDCDGPAALWAALSVPDIPRSATVEEGAILRAFSALPLHLRRHLGPMLAERLLVIDRKEAARAVRDAIKRAPGEHGEAARLIDARLDLAQGEAEHAEALLSEMATSDGAQEAEALILLIETVMGQGRAVDASLVTAVGALAFEHRKAPLGPALQRAHLRALASTGSFDAAFAEWRRAGDENGEPPTQLLQDLFGMLSGVADDEIFMRSYFAQKSLLDQSDPPAALRLSIARRLLSMGFPDESLAALGAVGRADGAGLLVAAEAELARGAPERALSFLAGLSEQHATEVAAEALSQLGRHRAAAEAFARLGRADRAASEWWRAGDWDQVARTGTDPQRIALSLEAGDGPTETTVSLAEGRRILDASTTARAAWGTLLTTPGRTQTGSTE